MTTIEREQLLKLVPNNTIDAVYKIIERLEQEARIAGYDRGYRDGYLDTKEFYTGAQDLA